MIWDNFSIFRTNCAIACGTHAYMLRGFFADVVQGKWRLRFTKSFMLLAHNSMEMESESHEIYALGPPQHVYVCWNLKYFRRKLFQ